MTSRPRCFSLFFFNDTATTEIYTLSLHDALPICRGFGNAARRVQRLHDLRLVRASEERGREGLVDRDRKSTRLNSSHDQISYAVFCLKKKNKIVAITACIK